jgi:hypothetical protein
MEGGDPGKDASMTRNYTDELAAALRRGRRRRPADARAAHNLTDRWVALVRAGRARSR